MTQSVPHPPPPPSTHAGYLSREDKREFTTRVLIAAGVFFFLEILIPMIAMVMMMPVFFFSAFNITEYDLDKAVVHDGDLFFIAEHMNQGRERRTGRHALPSVGIMKLHLANIPHTELASSGNPFTEIFGSSDKTGIQPEEVARVRAESPWLLAGGENLLIISESKMWKLEGTNLVEIPTYPSLGNASRPFYHKGAPAVIEGSSNGLSLAVFENGRWTEFPIFFPEVADFRNVKHQIQVVNIDGTEHMFLRIGKSLFHRIGAPIGSSREIDKGWKSICFAEHHWQAFALSDRPAVFCSGHNDLRIYTCENGQWSLMSHIPVKGSLVSDFAPVATGESLRVAATGFPGTLMIYSIDGDKLVLNEQFGSGFPFPKKFMRIILIINLVSLPLPIVLAVIISGLMLKHRVTTHWHEGKTAHYAPLSRRAFAQAVDLLIAFVGMLPLIVSSFTMFESFGTATTNPMMFPAKIFLNSGIAFLWMLFLLLVFSLGEGKWGATPGKWLLGIRVVGTDLRPCGFWRALVRNLLKIVDSYFSFLVGILTVTFTRNWQRVGDMLARTIVIRKTDA